MTALYKRRYIDELEYVGSVSWTSNDTYEFDLTSVWKEGRGKYYMASDSGCSCPSPFEDYVYIDQLDGPMLKRDLASNLNRMADECTRRSTAEMKKDIRELLAQLK